MIVRFTKAAAPTENDWLTCVRRDGSSTSAALPREGILPRLAVQFVAEATLSRLDGLFAAVTGGRPLAAAARRLEAAGARQAAALVDALHAGQWQGAGSYADFIAQLATAGRRRRVAPPEISARELERIRSALRAFGAAWRPLAPGGTLERTFRP